MPRIMIVNQAFPPFGGAASRDVVKMVKYLDREGLASVVITAPRLIAPLMDEPSVADVPESAIVIRTRSLEPVAGPGREVPGLPAFRRLLNVPLIPNVAVLWAACAVWPALAAAARHRPRAVICSTPESPSFLVGAAVKARYGVPLFLHYRDEWTTHPLKVISARSSVLHQAKFRLERRLEKSLCGYADRVLADTPGFRDEFIEHLGVAESKVTVIPNGIDHELFAGMAVRAGSGPRVLTHLGGFTARSLRTHVPEEIIRALDRACERTGKPAVLRIIGNVHEQEQSRLATMNTARLTIEITGFKPLREALASMMEGHGNLLLIEDVPGIGRYYNNKLFDYLGSGKPLLVHGPSEGVIGRLAVASGLGRVVGWGDEAGLGDYFERWLTDGLDLAAVDEAIAPFRWDSLAHTIAGLIEEAAG